MTKSYLSQIDMIIGYNSAISRALLIYLRNSAPIVLKQDNSTREP